MNRQMLIAQDMYEHTALQWAQNQPVDTKYGLGPSLARLLEAHPDYNPEMMEKAFYSLCLSGRWPGSKAKKSRFSYR